MSGCEAGAGLVLALDGDWVVTFWRVVALVTGAVVGSFLNVVIWRLPLGMSLARPPSACPRCQTPIRWFDNVPVVSWVLLRGRCRTCEAPISVRYPIVETLTGVLFFLAAIQYGGAPVTAGVVALALAALVAISFIDLDHRIIPDVITLPGIVVGVVAAPFLALYGVHHPDGFLLPQTPWLDALLCAGAGALVGGGVVQAVRLLGSYVLKKEAMGYGDVKLLAMIGAFVGPAWSLYALVLSCFAGALIGGVAYAVSRRRPVPCEGTVTGADDAEIVSFTRVKVRERTLWFDEGEPPAPPGAPVAVAMRLSAHRALTDEDVEARFAGRVAEADGAGTWGVRLAGPFRSEAHERAYEQLDAFSEPGRSALARLLFVLGVALSGAAVVALAAGQPALLQVSVLVALVCFVLAWLRRGRERPVTVRARTGSGKAKGKQGASDARAQRARLVNGVLVFHADRKPPRSGRVLLDLAFPPAVTGAPDDVEVTATGRLEETPPGVDEDLWRVRIDPGFTSEQAAALHDSLAVFGQSARYIPFGPFLALAGAAMLLYGVEVAWFVGERYPEWTRSLLGS